MKRVGDRRIDGFELIEVGMTYVDTEDGRGGDRVDAARLGGKAANRETCVVIVRHDRIVEQSKARNGGTHRIAAGAQRRRTGMPRIAADTDLQPARALNARHHADRYALAFEMRRLLDMEFDVSGDCRTKWTLPNRLKASKRCSQFIGQQCSILGSTDKQQVGQLAIDEGLSTHATRRKATAFLVRPDNQFERRGGFYSRVVKALQHFKRGEDAERAIEAATGRLGIKMTSDQKRECVGDPPRAADEEVRGSVLGNRVSACDGYVRKHGARKSIPFREGLPIDAIFRRRAYGSECVQPREQAHIIDRRNGGHELFRSAPRASIQFQCLLFKRLEIMSMHWNCIPAWLCEHDAEAALSARRRDTGFR